MSREDSGTASEVQVQQSLLGRCASCASATQTVATPKFLELSAMVLLTRLELHREDVKALQIRPVALVRRDCRVQRELYSH